MALNRPVLRTTKSTASMLRDSNAPVQFSDMILTKPEGTALTIESNSDVSLLTKGGISVAGLAMFQQLAQFNANVALTSPDFTLCLGPPEHDGTWRIRISQGYLIFEKYDQELAEYITKFQLY